MPGFLCKILSFLVNAPVIIKKNKKHIQARNTYPPNSHIFMQYISTCAAHTDWGQVELENDWDQCCFETKQ